MGKPEKIVAVAVVIVIGATVALALRRPAPMSPPEIKIIQGIARDRADDDAAKRARNALAKLDAPWELKREAARRDWSYVKDRTEALCRDAFREKMAYLEPDGEFAMSVDQWGGYQLLVKVRLADSFRAAPVGIVRCSVTPGINIATLEKVRM